MNFLLYIHHLEFRADLRMGCVDLTVALMYQAMLTAFDDKDTTFGNGINIAGSNYEVHRFYDEDGMLLFRLCGIFGNHTFLATTFLATSRAQLSASVFLIL
jgi:hypothetical protein